MRKRAAAAAIMAAVVLSCGCSAKKDSDSENAPEKPTSWSVEQRKVDDVTPLKGEEQVFIKRDDENDDIVQLIQGNLGDVAICDENDALELIASYSEEMGFNDVYSDLKFSGTTVYSNKTDYRFEQYYDGKKVLDSYVELTVDNIAGKKPIVLNSTYSDTWNFVTRPKVKTDDAVRCATDNYEVAKKVVPQLVILHGPVLAWKVPVKDSKVDAVYIDAKNGNTIRKDFIL